MLESDPTDQGLYLMQLKKSAFDKKTNRGHVKDE
jgi:hypothetical protein